MRRVVEQRHEPVPQVEPRRFLVQRIHLNRVYSRPVRDLLGLPERVEQKKFPQTTPLLAIIHGKPSQQHDGNGNTGRQFFVVWDVIESDTSRRQRIVTQQTTIAAFFDSSECFAYSSLVVLGCETLNVIIEARLSAGEQGRVSAAQYGLAMRRILSLLSRYPSRDQRTAFDGAAEIGGGIVQRGIWGGRAVEQVQEQIAVTVRQTARLILLNDFSCVTDQNCFRVLRYGHSLQSRRLLNDISGFSGGADVHPGPFLPG